MFKRNNTDKISLLLNCNYETDLADFQVEKLIIHKPNIYWCLDELSKLNLALADCNNNFGDSMDWLREIKNSYNKSVMDHSIYIEIVQNKHRIKTVEQLKWCLLDFMEEHDLIGILEHKYANECLLMDQINNLERNYIKRVSVWNMLDEILAKDKFALVKGLGGVGKSVLVTQYAHMLKAKHKNKYIIRFIDDYIESEYMQMASMLRIDTDASIWLEEAKYLVEKVYAKLASIPRTFLFVFDNLKEASKLRTYLIGIPPNVKIIVTARNAEASCLSTKFEVLELDEVRISADEANGYIEEKLTPFFSKERVDELIKGIFDKEKSISGERLSLSITYALRYHDQKALVEKIKTESAKTIANRLFRDINKESKERFLLDAVKYLDNNFISYSLAKSLVREEDEKDEEEEEKFINIVDNLEKQGLVSRINVNEVYGIKVHDNIKEVIDECTTSRVDVIDRVLESISAGKETNFKDFYSHMYVLMDKLDKEKNFG